MTCHCSKQTYEETEKLVQQLVCFYTPAKISEPEYIAAETCLLELVGKTRQDFLIERGMATSTNYSWISNNIGLPTTPALPAYYNQNVNWTTSTVLVNTTTLTGARTYTLGDVGISHGVSSGKITVK
jgi:hypothetical protein